MDKQSFMDEGISPLLGLGAGGLGGYALGQRVISPLLKRQENKILKQMRTGEMIVDKLRKGQRLAPILASAAGAILLASLATKKAKENERQRISDLLMYQQLGLLPGGEAGFLPQQQMPVGDPRSFY